MNKDTEWKGFCTLMGATSEVLGKQGLSRDGLWMMFVALNKYTLAEVREAVNAHLKSDWGFMFPTPAHIIKQIEGTEEERAEVQWRMLRYALQKYGYYDSVCFKNPGVHFAIKTLGGWVELSENWGNLTPKEIEFRKNDFIKLYTYGEKVASFDTSDTTKISVPSYLPGFFEGTNRCNGMLSNTSVVDVSTGERYTPSEIQGLLGASNSNYIGICDTINKVAANKRIGASTNG